jgi:hypothetical protein
MSNQNPVSVREARLVPFQDDEGFHICVGFIKEIKDDGQVVFDDEGKKILTYGTYEIAIQDLEICLSYAKHQLEAKQKEAAEKTASV